MRFAYALFATIGSSVLPIVSAAFSPEDLTGTWWSNATDTADAVAGNSSQVPSTRLVCPPWEPTSLTSQLNRVEIQTDDDNTYASKIRVCFWSSQEAAISDESDVYCALYAGLWDTEAGVLEAYSVYMPETPLYSTTLQLSALVEGDVESLAYKERGRVDMPGPNAKIGTLVKHTKIYKVSETPSFQFPSWAELSTPASSGVLPSSPVLVVIGVVAMCIISLHLL